MEIRIRNLKNLTKDERDTLLHRSETDITAVKESVSVIIENVRRRGDAAVRDYSLKFDKADLSRRSLRVEEKEFDDAEKALTSAVRNALTTAIGNVTRFHESQIHGAMTFNEIQPGVFAGEKITPVDSVALYVPRGRGSFPSMLYMMAVPARLAGVKRICVITPPDPDGSIDSACLYAAGLCGINEVYRVGGAQGIAAMVYGTETIPAVVKIVGPGSMYVTAAKRLLSDIVDTGLPAGPTESLVFADDYADPWNVAIDLMIEAEHGSDSQAILVTTSHALAEKTAAFIKQETEALPEPRKTFVKDVFSGYGVILVVETPDEAADFINEYAPEHLQIQTVDPFSFLHKVRNAGEILLGRNVPFSIANYAAGANAVLPTGGKAKTYSSVSVRDFQKSSAVVYITDEGYESLAPVAVTLADYEGFVTHAGAIRKRKKN